MLEVYANLCGNGWSVCFVEDNGGRAAGQTGAPSSCKLTTSAVSFNCFSSQLLWNCSVQRFSHRHWLIFCRPVNSTATTVHKSLMYKFGRPTEIGCQKSIVCIRLRMDCTCARGLSSTCVQSWDHVLLLLLRLLIGNRLTGNITGYRLLYSITGY